MSINTRKISADVLYNILKKKSDLSSELVNVRNIYGITSLDIRFVNELVNGTLRNLEYADYLISKASNIKINKISPYILCVLRTSVYQLLYMTKVPESAVVNEAVKLVKKSSNFKLTGFVNAVLRKCISIGNDVELPEEKIKYLSVKYSCPEWITKHYVSALDEEAEQLLSAMCIKPSTVLRVNTLKTTADELMNKLNSRGWICSKYNSDLFPHIDYLISADKVESIEDCPEYLDGHFYIQDPAAAYVGEIMNPRCNSIVFDMCASPGGKSTHFAQIMQGTGKVYSFDTGKNKIKKITDNANRLELKNICTFVGDSTVFMPEYEEHADYVLVDAPCSGLGIIRKKPDIKYLRKAEDIRELSKISLEILNNSSRYVKKGGVLLFSTCTTTLEENENVLFEFLKHNPEFHLKKIDCTVDNQGYITLYPHKNDCDGFFISYMVKE